jgi:hypothetical protein
MLIFIRPWRTRPISFLNYPDPIQEEILKQWGIKMVSSDCVDPSEALLDFLKSLEK